MGRSAILGRIAAAWAAVAATLLLCASMSRKMGPELFGTEVGNSRVALGSMNPGELGEGSGPWMRVDGGYRYVRRCVPLCLPSF